MAGNIYENIKTKYEKLLDFVNQDTMITPSINKMNPNAEVIAKSRQELDARQREIQQSKYISNQFYRVLHDDYIRYVAIESERRIAMLDYEMMEFYPTIANAWDILAEESTSFGNKGKMLSIYSDNKKIKEELERLFYKTLNINTTLFQWCRSMIKLGDNFVYLLTDAEKGVIGAKQLTNSKIIRVEHFNEDRQTTEIVFRNEETNRVYNNFMIAHFRLLGSESKFPYGTSVADKIRKVWKMLILAEDSMMIHRLVRGTSRNIFKVEVGNINDADRDSYVQRVVSNFKRLGQVDQNSNVNFRYNALNVAQDIYIPTVGGVDMVKVEKLESDLKPEIPDIEFLKDILISGLAVPRSFLNYDEPKGEGKNMAQADARFARKINRIQQCLIQELNKIAMIHLYLRGYEDEIENFKLKLTNPSTQADILRTEAISNKLDAYEKAIRKSEATNASAYSETFAKRYILEMTDEEIIEDLKLQAIERGIGLEMMEKVKNINSGLFDNLDKLKKKSTTEEETPTEEQATEQESAEPEPTAENIKKIDELITEKDEIRIEKKLKEKLEKLDKKFNKFN